MAILLREVVGGVSGEPRVDVVRRVKGGYKVFSEKTGRALSRAYRSKKAAVRRLQQIEYFKRRGDEPYAIPPAPGTARRNHPAAPPGRLRAAPDPNTRPAINSGLSADRWDARPRLPRQIPPTRHGEDYARALLRIVGRIRAAWAPVVKEVPAIAEGAARARGDGRMDAGETGRLKQLVAEAVRSVAQAVKQPQLEALARKFAGQVSDYQKEQLARQVRAALGADPVFRDRGLAARVDQFAHENAALVRTIPAQLHGELERIVTRAVSSGRLSGGRGVSAGTLRKDIEDRFGVAESRARVIARDQVGKFYAGVNHARQKEMGVKRFTWRTVGDERVRGAPGGKYANADPSHYDLDGNEYDYDDPPEAGPDGEPALPGEAVQCRCWAEPIFDDQDEDQDPGDED